MKKITLDSKIIWRRSSKIDLAEALYPSFYKDTIKREPFFQENFTAEIVDADSDKLLKIFAPLYLKEVASRNDFTLNKDTIIKQLQDKIADHPYKFLFIRYQEDLVTALMFAIKNNVLTMSYKANDKDFNKVLSHKATPSYWTEKLVFEYGKQAGVEVFSYGKDSNPYIGKTRLGLPLYKMKTGMKPRRPLDENSFAESEWDEEMIKAKNEPLLFFASPDSTNHYNECYLYYPSNTLNESYLKEFKKVFDWSNIKINLLSY